MDIQKNNMMRVLLYVCVGLLSVLTLLGAYTLYALNYANPEMNVEGPNDNDNESDVSLQEEIASQLRALTPEEGTVRPTGDDVNAQLETLTPEEGAPISTEEEVKAQLETLKNPQ